MTNIKTNNMTKSGYTTVTTYERISSPTMCRWQPPNAQYDFRRHFFCSNSRAASERQRERKSERALHTHLPLKSHFTTDKITSHPVIFSYSLYRRCIMANERRRIGEKKITILLYETTFVPLLSMLYFCWIVKSIFCSLSIPVLSWKHSL